MPSQPDDTVAAPTPVLPVPDTVTVPSGDIATESVRAVEPESTPSEFTPVGATGDASPEFPLPFKAMSALSRKPPKNTAPVDTDFVPRACTFTASVRASPSIVLTVVVPVNRTRL